ncbi:TetR/AcrR family transcriptional regulator [Deinococcus ruber]|uniref:HTH tetR-type domain-containing protein n=1 Tax=Deinococcus ruber TaxID=1848197 RepID=A0A918FG43_9DEIO|nr:TetR/AcrR family transcriptional regulator [Deinococcus ruber]GGR35721.1 hypothetical protein GCM10008957_51990 [Deinococcus ruber]
MVRRQQGDWIEAGFELLRAEGEQALTIERLCAALHLTKGSFYHHFKTMDVFRRVLLAVWLERHTTTPIQQAEHAATAREQMLLLGEIVARLDHRLDLAVRAWSFRNAEVRAAFDRVDRLRCASLEELYRRMDDADAEQHARREYAEFVGRQCLGWLDAGWPALALLPG